MYKNAALTDHMVDELAPQDVAMESFQLYSSFSHLGCQISRDGRTMTYKLPRLMDPARHISMARLTIRVLHLPLKVEHDLFKIDNLVIEQSLIIKYTGR